MAVIVFYEVNPIDKIQLDECLKNTDHQWSYIDDTLGHDNLNPDTEVLSVFGISRVTREIIERLPRLKLIATRTTGFDHIDLDAASSRNIIVVNVPNYGENTVAEHAFSLLLAVSRRLPEVVDATKNGDYVSSNFTGFDLKGKTLGILGVGHIGRHVAKIAHGFEMNVIAHDINEDTALAEELGFTYRGFNDVIMNSDIVSLHTPLTADNFHMINRSSLSRMKQGAILINTARGELVESRALIAALESGQIAGAGLDTIEGERFLYEKNDLEAILGNATSPDSYIRMAETEALLRMSNVVVTPHAAFNTTEAIARINETTAENIIKFWYGETPNRVTVRHSSGQLVIVRHGTSEWNTLGKWTGTTDVHITSEGVAEATRLGAALADIDIDYAYISEQVRTKETLEAFMTGAKQFGIHHEEAGALNERDYGVYTGMNKDKIEETIGKAAYDELRRSWDSPVEGGESLKDVYERAVPFYLRIILPRLRHGQNILVVAHGNSIRSLIKYIEDVSDEKIGSTEMIHDAALIYEVDMEGRAKDKHLVTGKASEPTVASPDPH